VPIHISDLQRRSFLKTSLGAGISLLTFRPACGDETSDGPEHIALLADTHIAADATKSARGSVMASNLLKVVADVLAQPTKPKFALIDGDCAFSAGQPEDYETLTSLVAAFPAANIPLHMTMGNHDDRAAFLGQFPNDKQRAAESSNPVEGRHVSLIETKSANWFLIDTLQKVNHVSGEMGVQQIDWLKQALIARSEKPAIVVGHHNPQFTVPESGRVTGLQDSQEVFEMLESQPHVKAYVFGHTHSWNTTRRESGLHLINLPPIGYAFNETNPIGWIDAKMSSTEMQLTLHSVDPDHPEHLKMRSLTW